MRKPYFFFTILLVLFACTAVSDGAQQWAKILRREGLDIAKFIQQTDDGGYILKADTESIDGSETWLVKLDSSGNVEWQKIYAFMPNLDPESTTLQQTSDSGYIVAGRNYGDFVLVRLNTEGEITWQKNYDWGVIDHAKSVQQTSDGGYIVAGTTYENSASPTRYDLWVLKLDSDGNIDWQKTYGGGAGDSEVPNDLASAIQETPDGGYIVAGYTWSFGAGNFDYWVLKLDGSGNVSWQKTYGDANHNYAESIQQTDDGGYIVAGYTVDALRHAWVLKLNSSGNVEWQKSYDLIGFNEVHSIQQTTDGGYIMAGGGAGELWLVKLESSGVISWEKTFGGNGTDVAFSIQETADGGYITAGYTLSFESLSYDVWVLKLDSAGEINSCDIVGISSATVIDTTVSEVDTSASVMTTDAIITDTSITPQNVSADIITICDNQPPYTSDHQPFNRQNFVAIETDIVVHVHDSGSGVDLSTIVMTVDEQTVATQTSGTPSDYTVTHTPSSVFDYEQVVNVTVSASDLAGNAMVPDEYSFITELEIGNPWDSADADGDDIPNSEEAILGTDANKKTLFVRARVFALGDEYWTAEFMALFPPPSGPANGRAYIDAFAEAGIEVVVIGAEDHPHPPMQDPNWDAAGDPTDFDPETDGIQPPHVNIMEVWKYNTPKAGSATLGHIGFYDDFLIPHPDVLLPDPDNPDHWIVVPQWRWDTKGLTPRPAGADPEVYLSPRVYIDPLDYYFTEGAYANMAAGATTAVTTCTDAACDMMTLNTTHFSPMNLNDTNYTLPPGPTSSDYGTVEVNNDIFFCAGTESHDVYGDGSLIYNCTAAGEIYHVAAAPRGDGYIYEDVLRRTLIHEMGHGLHFDHCTNPYCIMWMFVDNWELYDGSSQTRYGFGTTGPAGESCTHATGIRADGAIHNSISP